MPIKLSILVVSLAFTLACGSSGGEEQPSQTTITMNGTITITGDSPASGAFSAIGYTRQPSCAAYAAEGDSPEDPGPMGAEGTFNIPGPVIGVPLEPSGDAYASTLRILPAIFNGPGTYVNNDTITQISGGMVLEDIDDGTWYYPEDGTASATINADGSGSMTFDDIPEDTGGGIPSKFISGTINWTCAESE